MWREALLAAALAVAGPSARAPMGGGPCAECHPGWEVLPEGHPAVRGHAIAVCLTCHRPSHEAKPDPFSAALHRAHAPPAADCRTCHAVARGRFGLAGTKVALGRVGKGVRRLRAAVASWAGSRFLDAAHGRADVACAACHASELPDVGATVGRDRCLACHGPEDALAGRSAPAVHADRNPHRSHLGEIECTACHHAHAASEIYCLGCHPRFEMKLPGGG